MKKIVALLSVLVSAFVLVSCTCCHTCQPPCAAPVHHDYKGETR